MKVKKSFAEKVIENYKNHGGKTITHSYIYRARPFTGSGVTVYEVERFPNIPANSESLSRGKEYVGTMTSAGLWIAK